MNRDNFEDILVCGAYIVYIAFFLGLFLYGGAAIIHFLNGQWLFGIWAIFSIIILTKATLGLILIYGANLG